MTRSGESGIAIIITMFMVLVLSLLGSSLMFVSRTETLSSLNYQTMSQVRYAAESGLHSAANHILWTYVAPGTGADPIAAYDLTTRPVQFNGAPVVLSSNPNVASNYPVAAVRDAFVAAAQGTLNVNPGTVAYSAVARLLSMRQITDSATGGLVTLQTWEITGSGGVGGVGSAQLEVSATLERDQAPLFSYAAFATSNGCGALSWGGNSSTDSYDSSTYGGSGSPTTVDWGGGVGTNGNLDIGGSADIGGSLSTPRTGVGSCAAGGVNALTGNLAKLSEGLVQLPQEVTLPTPPAPNPLPPETNQNIGSGCPSGVPFCAASSGGATITPPTATTVVTMGNVSMGSHDVLHLAAGIYVMNSLSFGAQSELVVDGPGPVIIQIAGQNTATPLDMTGGSFSNPSLNASKLQFIYGGTGTIEMTGGSANSAVVYAPQAAVRFRGNGDFYGSMIAKTFDNSGNSGIHYDRNLANSGFTAGNPTLQSFNWKNY